MLAMTKPEKHFYTGEDVVKIARDLLGKVLVTEQNGVRTAGIITETEAYSYREKGCHAYGMKRTARTEIMFREGGIAYVYLCYGMHYLVNVVTHQEGMPEAVLIRAIQPCEGVEEMLQRRNAKKNHSNVWTGPAKVTQALGIDKRHNGMSFYSASIYIEDRGIVVPEDVIDTAPRVGIDYAGEDALLPWRFIWR